MTWPTARTAIMAIPSGVVPTIVGKGLPGRFTNDIAGHEQSPCSASRRYWGRVVGGAAHGPYQGSQTRMMVQYALTVEYIDSPGDGARLDVAITDDATRLIRSLAFSGNWQRPSSGIVSIAASGDIAPFTIDDVDGGRRLRIMLDIHYTTTLSSP